MEIERPTENTRRDPRDELRSEVTDAVPTELTRDSLGDAPKPAVSDSWAARPAPRRSPLAHRDRFDIDALKIFLILAGLTAGMALALRSLF